MPSVHDYRRHGRRCGTELPYPGMPGLDKVKNIPEDVLTHLENENFVLCITELKG